MRQQVTERDIEPVARWPTLLGSNDLDALPGLQLRVKGYQRAIYLGTAAAVAQIGMYTVGEINWGCTARQIDHAPLRRHDVNRFVERGFLVVFHPVRRIGNFVLPGQ